MTKAITILTAILVAIVALMAFTLSYYTLQEVALSNGIPLLLSYIWPLLIDFSLVVFSLTVVTANLHNETTWRQWTLVGVYTIATIFFNTLHAWPTLLPLLASKILVTCVPPLSLFFSFELLMNQLKNSVTYNTTIELVPSSTRIASIEQVTNGSDNDVTTELLPNDNQVTTRRQQVATLKGKASQADIAKQLGVSVSTIRNDMKVLNNGRH